MGKSQKINYKSKKLQTSYFGCFANSSVKKSLLEILIHV